MVLHTQETLAEDYEKTAAGLKSNKERVTILCCTNAAGTHHMKLLVTGKYSNPHALNSIVHLPVEYRAQQNA